MSDLPSGFRYLGVDWKIIVDTPSLREVGRYAQTDYRHHVVSIDPTWDDTHARQSLHHELMHVAEAGQLDGEGLTTEQIIRMVSPGLFGLLADNPELRRFIWPEVTDGDP